MRYLPGDGTDLGADHDAEARRGAGITLLDSTPSQLFRTNPAIVGTSPSSLWHQTILAGSERRVEVIRVSGVGPIGYWTASTRQGGICTALRMPTGAWARLSGSGTLGGGMPGCRPTRRQLNGTSPTVIIDGFDYDEIDLRTQAGATVVVAYGVVSTRESAVAVRDAVSGITARVAGGRYFAITLPYHASGGLGFRLEALGRDGRVLAIEPGNG